MVHTIVKRKGSWIQHKILNTGSKDVITEGRINLAESMGTRLIESQD